MASARTVAIVNRLFEIDTAICYQINRISRVQLLRTLFTVISRLGNGIFWYTLIALIAVFDTEQGYLAATHMLVTGLVGVVIYKLLKSKTVRPRPFTRNAGIQLCTAPLDQYSFPSGHTLHAFSFTIVACAYYPFLLFPLALFTAMVALSRMILGLHYPTDVAAGIVIGVLLGMISLGI
ncbi:MAG: phosphatase PAP2 family protein [Gammaproteobacteria bacterium]|nr:phosphatase PAP2 family protein [Gammaproteobacteria bacterium]